MDSREQTTDKNNQGSNYGGVDREGDPSTEKGFVPFHYNGEHYNILTKEYMLDKEFKSIEEAELFYYDYAKYMGFGVRKQDVKRGIGDRITMRRYVCNKEGERHEKWLNEPLPSGRSHRAITRENCRAAFQIGYKKNMDSYHVAEFTSEHSHPLASSKEAKFIPSHRHIPEADLAQATAMRKAAVRTCHIYDFLLQQAGGYDNIGFNIKDLYNAMGKVTRETLKEGDIEAALFYMQAKTTMDPEFFCKFSVDEENKLANLFWRDGTSLAEYSCFRDILMFDSTFKTNRYGKPLVFFVGVNNHRGNVLFASAFLANETADSYEWVLKTFLSAMNEKKPISVLTDGDEAMRAAIEKVLPQSRHRLCAWHVGKNAKLNLHFSELIMKFKKCMYAPMCRVQFDQLWQELVGSLSSDTNDWLKLMHAKKERWSNAYLAGHFFGGIQSTQRVESVHRCMKDFLRRNHMTIYECLPQLDKGTTRLRHKCALADYKVSSSTPALCTDLRALEEHAATVYTEGAFARVLAQIKLVVGLKCKPPIDFGHCIYYKISRYGEVGCEWVVYVHQESVIRYECPCKFFESEGIPCSHMFCTMKEADLKKIPEVLIKRRWTKDARAGFAMPATFEMVDSTSTQAARYGALSSLSTRLSHYGSQTTDGFNMVKSELMRITALAKVVWDKHRPTGLTLGRHENIVKDPEIVKSKRKRPTDLPGGVKAKPKDRQCSVCHEFGHTKRSCNKLKSRRMSQVEDVEPASLEIDDFDVGVNAADEQDGPIFPGMEGFDFCSSFDEHDSGRTTVAHFPTLENFLFPTNEDTSAPQIHSQGSQSFPLWHFP